MSSGVAWVLMSDVTMTLLFPLIDFKVVFLNPGLSSSPLFIVIYLVEKKKTSYVFVDIGSFSLHREHEKYPSPRRACTS